LKLSEDLLNKRNNPMQLLANTTSPYVRITRISMIEKGLDVEPTLVDPWADDARLRQANAATRVPTLVLNDNTPLTESLLIVQWLEATRPAPQWPSLLGNDPLRMEGVLSRAGIALGAIDASVHTIITRKVTAPILFDETPVGLRRRRTMVEGMQRLEAVASQMITPDSSLNSPTLDQICAVVLFDYQQFRYADQAWLPVTPLLKQLSDSFNERPSFERTVPHTT
jgi:glutathione S-transferase